MHTSSVSDEYFIDLKQYVSVANCQARVSELYTITHREVNVKVVEPSDKYRAIPNDRWLGLALYFPNLNVGLRFGMYGTRIMWADGRGVVL